MKQMIHIGQLKLPLNHTKEDIIKKACQKLRAAQSDILEFEITKQSIDARKKGQIQYIYAVNLKLAKKVKLSGKHTDISVTEPKKYQFPAFGSGQLKKPPVIIGTGPAGLFCAYLLALNGYCPRIFERGKTVEQRQKDVEAFWETGVLNPESNVQFGEGGAGTFSDGKLNTAVKDKYGRNRFVLETFVSFGAPEDILYVNKPHIGTDILKDVVRRMREKIQELGGEFYFDSCVTDILTECGRVRGITVNHQKDFPADLVVFAGGHSARDTFSILEKKQFPMEAKSFAVGFRVEHPQDMIQMAQYETTDRTYLPAADYKVTYHAANGRSVYSFCMCPGGYVVNASSEEEKTVVNGMSYRKRDSRNANSAIIVSVTPDDFSGDDVLAGMRFQQKLEHAAYQLGKGKIPQQLFGDFENNRISEGYGSFGGCEKGQTVFADLRSILPEELNTAFCEGMHGFASRMKGFDRSDTILSAVESRTSSPVRILRDETFESSVRGFYPCGEGAGYAGGITSAAMDGMKTAEAVMKKYIPQGKIGNGR